jgi:hypothetical protein
MSKESHIPEKAPIKKSVFAPIRSSAAAIERVKAAATEAKAKQEAIAPKKEAPVAKQVFTPTQVQIWDEVVSRPDRSVFSWSYIANRSASVVAIVAVVNVDHWLVKRAFLTQDEGLIALVLGMALGECLTYRAGATPWLRALLKELRELLFKGQDENLKALVGVQFLGGQLAGTAAFKKASIDLLAPGGAEPGKKHLVATISLQGEVEGGQK